VYVCSQPFDLRHFKWRLGTTKHSIQFNFHEHQLISVLLILSSLSFVDCYNFLGSVIVMMLIILLQQQQLIQWGTQCIIIIIIIAIAIIVVNENMVLLCDIVIMSSKRYSIPCNWKSSDFHNFRFNSLCIFFRYDIFVWVCTKKEV
jgi:ABC-type Fe3+-siderophore transport system permease subunit